MEKTRRKSSASEFFSRRHSSSLFQSMRRYSSSTIFGPRPASGSGAGDTKTNGASEKRKGRRHSTTQLHVSSAADTAGGPHDKLKIVANGLGDVDELQEGYGEAVDGSETGRAENDEHMMKWWWTLNTRFRDWVYFIEMLVLAWEMVMILLVNQALVNDWAEGYLV